MTKKYLIIGPSWVGDMVMAHSLVRFIKQQDATACIDILAPTSCLSLAKFMPEINSAIELPFKHGEFSFWRRRAFGRSLRANGYTNCIVLPNSWKSALIPFFAGIPVRTGWLGEARYLLLNNARKLDKSKYPLMIERFCALALVKNAAIPDLPAPKFSVSSKLQDAVVARFKLDKKKPVLALCPGAEFGPAKRWPDEYYAEVANAMLQKGFAVWLLGAPGDIEVCSKINATTGGKCVDFAGKTKLEEAVTVLSLSTKVLSNDSGLMHISSALDKKTLVVYGSSSAKFTPPLSKNASSINIEIECRPCFKRTCPLQHMKCLNDLKPDMVLRKLCES